MTSEFDPKEQVWIQRGDMLYCDECGEAHTLGQDEIHARTCPWYVRPPRHKDEKAKVDAIIAKDMERVRGMAKGLGPALAGAALRLADEGEHGWICSRCTRVYSPRVTECPHCQPPGPCAPTDHGRLR